MRAIRDVMSRRVGVSARRACLVSRWAVVVSASACVLAAGAGASDVTLRTSINTWSTRLGLDAHSVALAANQRHPGRMTNRATVFRHDALEARVAIARRRATTARGARAKRLALAAFGDYASAGAFWAASGRARYDHRITAATALARKAARYARAGSRVLVTAGKLLR